jgi:hypothetical protein
MSIEQFITITPKTKSFESIIEKKNVTVDSDDESIQCDNEVSILPYSERIKQVLQPYKNHSYIPNNIIKILLKAAFPSYKQIVQYNNLHGTILIPLNELLKAKINNYEYNRPADEVRCIEIKQDICKNKQPIETMFTLSFNNKTWAFDVIDGIHRYTALKMLETEHINEQIIHKFNWLYNTPIIANIRFNSSDGELVDVFKTLNKCMPVPELYISDVEQGKDKIKTIQDIVNEWQTKYKSHFSANKNPNRPNINRDTFIDIVSQLYDKYNIRRRTSYILEDKLNKANSYLEKHYEFHYKKPAKSVVEKCKTSGCWLFIVLPSEIQNIIDRIDLNPNF